jgi:putative FmdB family regulatory protein
MPTYAYECRECGHRFERFQAMTEPPVAECPECGGKVRRLIGGGAGIIFRGSGFYETDCRRGGSGTRCGSDRTCCGRDTPCDAPPCGD